MTEQSARTLTGYGAQGQYQHFCMLLGKLPLSLHKVFQIKEVSQMVTVKSESYGPLEEINSAFSLWQGSRKKASIFSLIQAYEMWWNVNWKGYVCRNYNHPVCCVYLVSNRKKQQNLKTKLQISLWRTRAIRTEHPFLGLHCSHFKRQAGLSWP